MSDSKPSLTPEQEQALVAVLDEIVPARPDGRVPGAGALGLVGFIEDRMRETPDLRPAIVQGLAALERLAAERGAGGFPQVPAAERADLLNALSTREPAFLPGLIFQTYVGYYQQPIVLEALGVEGRPPHPQGYAMEPLDPSLLEPVRRRGPFGRRL